MQAPLETKPHSLSVCLFFVNSCVHLSLKMMKPISSQNFVSLCKGSYVADTLWVPSLVAQPVLELMIIDFVLLCSKSCCHLNICNSQTVLKQFVVFVSSHEGDSYSLTFSEYITWQLTLWTRFYWIMRGENTCALFRLSKKVC